MIVCIESSYSFKIENLSEEELAFLNSENAIRDNYIGTKEFKYVGQVSGIPVSLLNKRNDITIEFFKNNPSGDVSNLLSFSEFFSKTDFVNSQKNAPSINIHIPSPELSYFNKVDWLEDSCTNELQKMLDDGWRIIAVIPRPGQRRPDYILGKRTIS
jgi:hypothetical protein